MDRNGPILVLTASAGAGHTVAARALEAAFRKRLPDADVEYHDVLAASNGFFRQMYGGGYLLLVNHAPTVMGWIYDSCDRPGHPLQDRLRIALQDAHVRPTMRFLAKRRPRLIVNTHFLPAEIVARMRQQGRLNCPQTTVVTDFETHRIWQQQPTERYYAPTELGAAYLTASGVEKERVLITGIPVRSGFENPLDRGEMRRKHGLDNEAPVVLLLAGGFGVGPTEQLLGELTSVTVPIQIVVIAGRNEKLRQKLAAAAKHAAQPVHVVGFTDLMHEWMRAADLVVTKPGGLTASEALVCALPLVIVNPIPGQETRNSDYLLEHGAGLKVNNPALLGHRVSRLLEEADRLQAMRAAALRLAKPDATTRIVDDALKVAEQGAELTPAAGG